MRLRIAALGLAVVGVVAVAVPASATVERYRLVMPPTAKAGTTLTGIWGDCVGEYVTAVESPAFVGGKAKLLNDRGMFHAEAEMVTQPGRYYVDLFCQGSSVDGDDVTIEP